MLSGDVHVHYGADLKMDFTDPKSETVATEFTGEEPAIAFSPGYLLDGLAAALIATGEGTNGEDARILLQFTSPTKPAVITGTRRDRAGEAPDFRYLVVPLRALASA